MSKPIPDPKVWPDAHEQTRDRRFWAALMLSADLEVVRSMCACRPVLAKQLDGEALRRALRARAFPAPESYIEVTVEMLDAVAEGGPFE
jgi:hypothetical protein